MSRHRGIIKASIQETNLIDVSYLISRDSFHLIVFIGYTNLLIPRVECLRIIPLATTSAQNRWFTLTQRFVSSYLMSWKRRIMRGKSTNIRRGLVSHDIPPRHGAKLPRTCTAIRRLNKPKNEKSARYRLAQERGKKTGTSRCSPLFLAKIFHPNRRRCCVTRIIGDWSDAILLIRF